MANKRPKTQAKPGSLERFVRRPRNQSSGSYHRRKQERRNQVESTVRALASLEALADELARSARRILAERKQGVG